MTRQPNTDLSLSPVLPEARVRQYERSGLWRVETLGQVVHHWARHTPSRIALVDGARRLSYAELSQTITAVAGGLTRRGLNRGDRILIQLPNSVGFVVLCLAACAIGARPVLAMPAHRASEINALCALAQPVAYAVTEDDASCDYRALARSVAGRHAVLKTLLIDGAATPGFVAIDALHTDGITERLEPPPLGHHRDVALFLLSGGTTGLPKLIPRTHADYAYNARASAIVSGLDAASVYLAALPIAHNFALACPGLLGTFAVGGTVVLAPAPTPDVCVPLIQEHGVTHTALVPPLVPLWTDAAAGSELASLRVVQVGGACLDRALAVRVERALGCTLQQVFGMAEGLLCFTRLSDADTVRYGTQGRPLSPADELRIVDEHDQDVPTGAAGELLTRGPYTLAGYYRAEEENRRAFTPDGFFRTGDVVCRDAGGNIQVVGRIKDQINRGGEKIAAPELETHVRAYAGVREAVAIAAPDAIVGERCVVLVVCDGPPPNLRALRVFLQERGVAAYKHPDRVLAIDALPLTPVGKVDKKFLRARYALAKARDTRLTLTENEVES